MNRKAGRTRWGTARVYRMTRRNYIARLRDTSEVHRGTSPDAYYDNTQDADGEDPQVDHQSENLERRRSQTRVLR